MKATLETYDGAPAVRMTGHIIEIGDLYQAVAEGARKMINVRKQDKTTSKVVVDRVLDGKLDDGTGKIEVFFSIERQGVKTDTLSAREKRKARRDRARRDRAHRRNRSTRKRSAPEAV